MEVFQISLKHSKTCLQVMHACLKFQKKANSNLDRNASHLESANFSRNSKIEANLLCVPSLDIIRTYKTEETFELW